jgi:ZIP family zinc transporter
VSASQTVLLGGLAGGTIFIALPLGRVENLSHRTRQLLATVSAGILLFLLYEVAAHAVGLVGKPHGAGAQVGRGALLAGGFALGLVGIHQAQRFLMSRRALFPVAGGSAATIAASGLDGERLAANARRASLVLGMLIAGAIGIHNFSEGLAIGVSARAGELALAGTLIAGFALHNATEGFGILGPLHGTKPSWRWLIAAGVIGGAPTLIGTAIGYRVSSEWLQLVFMALAAGAILFVARELARTAFRRMGPRLVIAGLAAGVVIGLMTETVLELAGAA